MQDPKNTTTEHWKEVLQKGVYLGMTIHQGFIFTVFLGKDGPKNLQVAIIWGRRCCGGGYLKLEDGW